MRPCHRPVSSGETQRFLHGRFMGSALGEKGAGIGQREKLNCREVTAGPQPEELQSQRALQTAQLKASGHCPCAPQRPATGWRLSLGRGTAVGKAASFGQGGFLESSAAGSGQKPALPTAGRVPWTWRGSGRLTPESLVSQRWREIT